MLRRDMQTQTKYVIGVDFGSDSVRCLIVDTADGRKSLGGGGVSRWKERLYCDPSLNRYRQHPLDYIESLSSACAVRWKSAAKRWRTISGGISFDTTASTPALTDERGVPLALRPNTPKIPMRCSCFGKTIRHWPKRMRLNDLAKRWEVDYTRYAVAPTPANGCGRRCCTACAAIPHCVRKPVRGSSTAIGYVHC